jgi:hypothetical protein
MLKLRLWARGLVVSLVYVLDVLGLQPYRGNIRKLRQVASLDVEPSLPLLQTYGAHQYLNSSSNIKTGSSAQIEKSAARRSDRAGLRLRAVGSACYWLVRSLLQSSPSEWFRNSGGSIR